MAVLCWTAYQNIFTSLISVFTQVENLHMRSSANGFWVKFSTLQTKQTKPPEQVRDCRDEEKVHRLQEALS